MLAELDPNYQTGIAMAIVATASTIVGSLVGWMKERDKLKYDVQLSGLQSQNVVQAKQIDDLKQQNATQAGEIADLKRVQAECLAKHRECEESHRKNDKRLKELESVVAKLKLRET